MEAEMIVCRRCKEDKPISEYYTRSGLPHLHLKMCKACYRELRKLQAQSATSRRRAVVQSEKEIIDLLEGQGIPALPGKALGHQYADIIAWGCVLVEAKYSQLRNDNCFSFSFTPQQRKLGVRGDLIVLVCDYGDKTTRHVFLASDPIFYYLSGNLRGSLTYAPFAKRKRNHANRIGLTDALMDEHQNKWELIETIRLNVHNSLLSQSESQLNKLRVFDAPDDRMMAWDRRQIKQTGATLSSIGSQPI
jgi:hypothetical protein